jgi:hypothetical protein
MKGGTQQIHNLLVEEEKWVLPFINTGTAQGNC